MSTPSTPVASIIIGGGVRNCTSSNGARNCPNAALDWDAILDQDPAFSGLTMNDVVFDRDAIRSIPWCEINADNLARLATIPGSLLPTTERDQIHRRLSAHDLVGRRLPSPELRDLVGVDLSNAQWAVVSQCMAAASPDTSRKVELRTVRYLTDAYSKGIYESVVQAARTCAGGATPRIGVITAASDNPFEETDINVHALRSAGAETVYVPLQGGLRKALDCGEEAFADLHYEAFANTHVEQPADQSCRRFPDYAAQLLTLASDKGAPLDRLLESLDGLYFSGGDQARILEALVTRDREGNFARPSKQLEIIRQRFAQGRLVIAGTSAGNHIQGGGRWKGRPVPMIGGGDSYPALVQGFATGQGSAVETPGAARLYPYGGLGTFPWGVLDSHFSQRCREGRLARATLECGMDYGFGIDENTALLVHRADADGSTRMQVRGEGGVWVVEVRDVRRTPRVDHALQADGFIAHYLHEGDHLRLQADGALQVELSPQRPPLASQAEVPAPEFHRIQEYESGQFAALTAAMGRSGAASAHGDTRHSQDGRTEQGHPPWAIRMTRTPTTVFRGDDRVVSYSGLQVAFGPLEL
ncbi:cyanophycinase [Curvibacter sp. APW13]|uniref:cyanophycinase n=1 Tax=Curvibacter sp. APW13 TaxID=3077236 RepID=UPI0028DE468B|nr:cyanophycinase [Curvibacter sp. APW13]MDT8990025.1 cyanophycinase [Curvibacter sp. APW13]